MTARPRARARWLWFLGIWAASVAIVGGVAEALHWWIRMAMPG